MQKTNSTPAKTETQILDDLGVPTSRRNHVVILSSSAHMDWDWLERFPILTDDANVPYFKNSGYDRQPADTILDSAQKYMKCNKHPIPPEDPDCVSYYYDVCEMGFLRDYCEDPADGANRIETLKSLGERLRIVGGGTTSPDNLLPNGEAFIRDYLVGVVWAKTTLGHSTSVGWIPDDFGHDPQLPVVFEAMGIPYIGFARVPGDNYTHGQPLGVGSRISVAESLRTSGCDFIWEAADGSSVQAHWMPNKYSQGYDISQGSDIEDYVSKNCACSVTNYVHVPICNDFMNANENLLSYIQSYNSKDSGHYAVLASFADYAALVSFQKQKIKTHQSFLAFPYWMGFYASRPANKSYHQLATRALLGAETFSLIATLLGVASSSSAESAVELSAAWELLTPSTHHDYITGTAGATNADVYAQEQLPLLARALRNGEALFDKALQDISGAIATNLYASNTHDTPFLAFNQLGFERTDVVEIQDAASLGAQALNVNGNRNDLVQATADGNLLALVTTPSLGYSLNYVNTAQLTKPTSATAVSISQDLVNDTVTLSNGRLSATISSKANWGISILQDLTMGREIITGNMELEVFDDNGSIYTFGNEQEGELVPSKNTTWTPGVAQIIENGPLRVKVDANVAMAYSSSATSETVQYKLQYSLTEGEDFIRVAITGRAPSGTSVMIRLPMDNVASITRGSGYHWDSQTPVPYSPDYLFYPCHDYVLANDGSGKVASTVIYQSGIPCWGYAIDAGGTPKSNTPLLGVIFRNTPASAWGAGGPDNGTHTQCFALASSSSVGTPADGVMLKQSRRYSTPLIGKLASPFSNGKITQPEYSLATLNGSSAQPAFITAAKAGSFNPSEVYLRVYNPTNNSVDSCMRVAPELENMQVSGTTALEGPLTSEQDKALNVVVSETDVSFNAVRAITTLKFQ